MINRRYAVLGLLIEEPDYGYRLTRRMQERLGSMQIGRTYVYSLLKRLEEEGLVYRSAEERSASGATRAVFAASERGVEHFAGWMSAPVATVPWYEDLHLKVAFSRESDLPELIVLLRWRERECLALLEGFEQSARHPSEERGWARSAAVLVRNADIDHLQTMVRWLQSTCAVMQRTVEEARRRSGGAAGQA